MDSQTKALLDEAVKRVQDFHVPLSIVLDWLKDQRQGT